MRDLKLVNQEIKEITRTNTLEMKQYAINKLRKRIEFLEVVRNYLESEPTDEFVAKEKNRIDKLIKTINDGFTTWYQWNKDKGEDYKSIRTAYDTEMELKKYKTQYKALDFILS